MIRLNDIPVEELGLYTRPGDIHPLSPNIKTESVKVPGRHGSIPMQSRLDDRKHDIPLAILKDRMDEAQLVAREFVQILFDGFGMPKTLKLIYDYEPDKFYYVKLDDGISPDRFIGFSDFVCNFISHDPFAYSTVTSDEITWGSEIITFEYHYLLGHEGAGGMQTVNGPKTINVEVDGLAVRPIFEIEGTANNLTIIANGYSFTVPDFNDESWIIDFGDYTVLRNGKETMIDDMRKFYLLPGENEIDIKGSNINIEMTIKYRDKFV